MSHIVLLGDSIFDNARYVPDRPPVIEQVRRGLPLGWQATLVAVDGHTVEDIVLQLPRVPAAATHLVLSIGGNDALGAGSLLGQPAATVGDCWTWLTARSVCGPDGGRLYTPDDAAKLPRDVIERIGRRVMRLNGN